MSSQTHKIKNFALLTSLSLFLIMSLVWNVGAASNRVAPVRSTQTRLAVVDLERLQQGLNEWAVLESKRKEAAQIMQDDLLSLADQLKAFKEEVEALPPNSDARIEAVIKVKEHESLVATRKELFQFRIDLERGNLIRTMYNKITQATATLAAEDGWDMIVVDDQTLVPPRATFREVNAAISQRRILFASDAIDITQRLEDMMNNDYSAQGNG